ncbi:MAG: hypothetical protein V7704_20665 [Aurantimonas endophytica]|uniref:hypothetical protein n=1 Tax=Aurantimonas endophytica TaxID=1522175 RepID=UPI0030017012
MASKTSGTAATKGGTAAKGGATAKTADPGAAPANVAAATGFEASGAPQQVVGDVDPGHPAVDDNPRAGTTVDQNKIDFNDPTIPGSEAVKRNLEAQAKD